LETDSKINYCNVDSNYITQPFGLKYQYYGHWKNNPVGKYFFILHFRDREDIPFMIDEAKQNDNVFLILHDTFEGYARRRFKKIHNFVEMHDLKGKVYFASSLLSTAEEHENWCKKAKCEKLFEAFYYPEWYHIVDNNLKDYQLSKFKYNKEKYFCCLNNRHHMHRINFVDNLIENGLIDKGLVSSNYHGLDVDGLYNTEHRGSRPQNYNPQIYDKCLINVVTETFYDKVWNVTGNIFFSEKTWKPIVCKQAFILVGPRYSLKYLKELGFKTFDSLWDESYDEADHTKRLYMAANTLYNVLDTYSLEELNRATKKIRMHNFKHFTTIREHMTKTCT